MNNVTIFQIFKPANDVFEAFVDPEKIGNFWFSSGSERWEQGKIVTLRYEEYDAEGDIKIIEMTPNSKIVFQWGGDGEGNMVTITIKEIEPSHTEIEIVEEGFNEKDEHYAAHLVDNKEGWVYMLTCLKGYLEFGINSLRAALVKR